MVKWSAVIVGFILAICVKSFMPNSEFIGLLAVGFIVGLMVREGFWSGMSNAAIAGALGTIVGGIIFIIMVTTGSTALGGIFGGMVGFTLSGTVSIINILVTLIYYMVVMGISGGIGGMLLKKQTK